MNSQLSMFDAYDWKSAVRHMLAELEDELELPKGSLLLQTTFGRKTGIVTSYPVVIYEPEYPPIPNAQIDEKRNSVVFRVEEKELKKEDKTVLEVIMNKGQYDSLYKPNVLSMNQRESEPDVIRLRFEMDSPEFIEYVKENTRYRVKYYTSKEATFSCCSRFVECSDAKKCLHPNKLFAQACYYKHNLESGRIFYGKNKNVDETGKLIDAD